MEKGRLPKHVIFDEVKAVAGVTTFNGQRKDYIRCCAMEGMATFCNKRDRLTIRR